MKRALITGITGQDGSYLAELLLDKGYEVHGTVRRISQPNVSNLSGVIDRVKLHGADMIDALSLLRIIDGIQPDEIYNLAALSQVRDSYDQIESTKDINASGLMRILEITRILRPNQCRIYQACSSEMFGRIQEPIQSETTPFYPISPYGISKHEAYQHAKRYRETYGMHVCCGILFNHESPRRGPAFVSRKICIAVAEIAAGLRDRLTLGNLDAKRDFGYAREYVEWIYAIMQHPTPDDFVIATGENHSIKEWVELAFSFAGIPDWENYVDYDKSLTRPAEVDTLLGDASKSKRVLGFEPKVKFRELVEIMMRHELEQVGWKPTKTSGGHSTNGQLAISKSARQ